MQDNRYGTWNAYQNEFWPAEYLIDSRGHVRHTQFGEGDYKQSEAAVRELLYEAGVRDLPPPMSANAILPSAGVATPETYLDPERAQGFAQPLTPGVHPYQRPGRVALNQTALNGIWRVGSDSVTPVSRGASIELGFQAAKAYLVMTSADNVPRPVVVLLDGRPYSTVTVRGQQLYTLVSLPSAQQHSLTVRIPPGVSAYDFTFG